MIFVTVGTQLPFERLIQAVDAWASENPSEEVFVQLGETSYRPKHCRYAEFVGPQEWETSFLQADRVVSHAGMGTIIKALHCDKPLIVMPRMASLGEHRNDHQLATAARFRHVGRVQVVESSLELSAKLSEPALACQALESRNEGLDRLLKEIQHFVHDLA